MTTVSTEQVQNDLPSLLERLKGGETLLIEQNGEPVGTLTPVASSTPKVDVSKRLGLLEGQATIPDNWKEIAREEIEREFYGEEAPLSVAQRPPHPRLGFLKGQGTASGNWKELDRKEIEEEFYGKE